jgi:tyrosyl-tRNA synthetase
MADLVVTTVADIISYARRYHLISRGLSEILGGEEELVKLVKSKKEITVMWGTATTGKPHVGYFVPARKIADLLRAGCRVIVLFADIHALLDEADLEWKEQLTRRLEYYEVVIAALLRRLEASQQKLEFVRGSDYQTSHSYVTDLYKLVKLVTQRDAKKAGSDVVKKKSSPTLAGDLYPCLQALDEKYLGVDCHVGGVDQRKAFTFAEKYLPKLGCRKKIHLMTPMVQGLTGSKMSSSAEMTKVNLLDDRATVKGKIDKAFCESGNVERNGPLAITEHVIFPNVANGRFDLTNRRGDTVTFDDFGSLRDAFENKTVHPIDLKNAVFTHLDRLLSPIRSELDTSELTDLEHRAYTIVQ